MTQRPRDEHHFKHDREWRDALQYALDEAVGEPAAESALSRPELSIVSVSESGSRFEIQMRFRSGLLYCCCEPGCFLATYDLGWWQVFRDALAEVSDRRPPSFVVVVHGVVEQGAQFRSHDAIGVERASPGFAFTHGAVQEFDARP